MYIGLEEKTLVRSKVKIHKLGSIYGSPTVYRHAVLCPRNSSKQQSPSIGGTCVQVERQQIFSVKCRKWGCSEIG